MCGLSRRMMLTSKEDSVDKHEEIKALVVDTKAHMEAMEDLLFRIQEQEKRAVEDVRLALKMYTTALEALYKYEKNM